MNRVKDHIWKCSRSDMKRSDMIYSHFWKRKKSVSLSAVKWTQPYWCIHRSTPAPSLLLPLALLPGSGLVSAGYIHTGCPNTLCSTATRVPDQGQAGRGLPLPSLRAVRQNRRWSWWSPSLDRRSPLQRVKVCGPEFVVFCLQRHHHVQTSKATNRKKQSITE